MVILSRNLAGGTEEEEEYSPDDESTALSLRQLFPVGFIMRGMVSK
jgi:hypothetical protein